MLRAAASAVRSLAATTSSSAGHARAGPAAALASVRARAYHESVVDHYENPRNVGSMDKNDRNVGTGLVGAPACGDVMKLQIRVNDDGEIVESKFKTFGCGSAIASSSLATEWVKGMNVDQAVGIKNRDIAKELRLPPVKLHCSMLAEDAIKAAVSDIMKKRSEDAAKATATSLKDEYRGRFTHCYSPNIALAHDCNQNPFATW
jgi:iron-sulfur cluster assembly enzyme ISCU, mitochondrial